MPRLGLRPRKFLPAQPNHTCFDKRKQFTPVDGKWAPQQRQVQREFVRKIERLATTAEPTEQRLVGGTHEEETVRTIKPSGGGGHVQECEIVS